MSTIRDIAQACNVSVATVSNIMNNKGRVSDETRAMVLSAISSMGYVPSPAAQKLKQQKTKTIGVITEDLTVFNTPEIVDGINAYLDEKQYSFILSNLRIYKKYGPDFNYHNEFKEQLNEELDMMKASKVDGLIYISAHSRDLSNVLPSGADSDCPMVIAYGFSKDESVPCVTYDDSRSAMLVTQELLKHEPERVGVIAGSGDSIHTANRLKGFQKALLQHKILYDPDLVLYGNWSREYGCYAAEKLIQKNVSTIFSMNDLMAAGVYDYALDAGLTIGKDLFLCGIGTAVSSFLKPPLTTISIPLAEIGAASARTLLAMINGSSAPHITHITGHVANAENGSA